MSCRFYKKIVGQIRKLGSETRPINKHLCMIKQEDASLDKVLFDMGLQNSILDNTCPVAPNWSLCPRYEKVRIEDVL